MFFSASNKCARDFLALERDTSERQFASRVKLCATIYINIILYSR